jgi:hypothetical protein
MARYVRLHWQPRIRYPVQPQPKPTGALSGAVSEVDGAAAADGTCAGRSIPVRATSASTAKAGCAIARNRNTRSALLTANFAT